jgi:tRNA-dihydrouridine synthase A
MGKRPESPWNLCVAPMMDWTDRHCRALHRIVAPHARLYTEMVTSGALLHGDIARHLDFDASEHPVALQLGGSDPTELARCARLGERWGYDEINLNCGCPSERVQRGSFGVCLMAEPALVADCVRAMRDAVALPVTIKHRLGIDRNEDYGFVRDFVGRTAEAGCSVFIVHARNAWLKGLSPKENRDVPPLRYEVARRLKADFPHLAFVLNGGLASVEAVLTALDGLDGVMIGRAAYHQPHWLAQADAALFDGSAPDPMEFIEPMSHYVALAMSRGAPAWAVIRHALGLMHGRSGAREFRRRLSDPAFVTRHGADALRAAATRPADALA